MRGDVVRVPADEAARGHEQRGPRYGVIVQSDDLPLSTVLVTPTSTGSRPALHRPEVEILGTRTRLLPEHTRAISRDAIPQPVSRLSYAELRDLDEALALVLELD